MEERLHKILAHAGVGSLRECEKLILQGEVTVNGQTIAEVGVKVDPETSAIKVRGKRLHLTDSPQKYHYFLLHKPAGYLTTMKPDPEGRPTLLDLLWKIKGAARLYPVGRLDFNSEGLILLTNDGELAYRLTHPKFKVPKIYQVKVHGIPTQHQLDVLSHGVMLDDGKTQPAAVKIIRVTGKNAWVLVTISEGRKRQIRRMCEKIRLPITKLRRISIGPLKLQDLERGQYRTMLPHELAALKKAIQLT